MSDALPLPARPNLEQYKKLAKELREACRAGDVRVWAESWVKKLDEDAGAVERVMRVWQRQPHEGACTLSRAQFHLARFHGFESWPTFAKHVEEVRAGDTGIARFEAAADAIVRGDLMRLDALLAADPELVHARSTRDHQSTLLHYVSANGVEDFRQMTPPNIVEIAKRLLAAGAEVDATSEAYGGGSTALNLTATSYHPQAAGVQVDLLQLLLDHGARLGPRDVVSCLANGRGPAAEFLAERGAKIDFEAAAGVGRLDLVESLAGTATPAQIHDAFAWACEFGRTAVATFLLDHGVDVAAKLRRHHGQTGLHWAAYGGHADTVALLLERGAPLDVKDDTFDGTPLEWALYAWRQSPPPGDAEGYDEVVRRLVRAGARLDPQREITDPRMVAALRDDG